MFDKQHLVFWKIAMLSIHTNGFILVPHQILQSSLQNK